MADAQVLGTCIREGVWVRVPPPAPSLHVTQYTKCARKTLSDAKLFLNYYFK